jgi:hypothetical protein
VRTEFVQVKRSCDLPNRLTNRVRIGAQLRGNARAWATSELRLGPPRGYVSYPKFASARK